MKKLLSIMLMLALAPVGAFTANADGASDAPTAGIFHPGDDDHGHDEGDAADAEDGGDDGGDEAGEDDDA